MSLTHQKFTFDTVFDDDGGIASEPVRTKRVYTPEEVQIERAKAYAEGEASVTARAEQVSAAALGEIAGSVRAALTALSQVAHEHRSAAAGLALACARAIADAALEKFPEAPVTAALEALAREIEAEPRLVVRAHPVLVERMQAALDRAASAVGFAGQILVRDDAALPPAAFVFDWGDGRAVFDPVDSAARVAAALNNALAAESLHAEPLLATTDGDV